jgi:hypothetical protein
MRRPVWTTSSLLSSWVSLSCWTVRAPLTPMPPEMSLTQPGTTAPVVGLMEAILRLVTPLMVLNEPVTYSLVPSGEASTAVTPPPPKVGRKPVSISPVW